MSFASRELRFRPPGGALAAAAALLLAALAAAPRLPAASVSSAEAIDAAPHHCKCGPRCRGASCCCGPRATPSRPPAPVPDRADARPCMNSAPCGDPALPGAPSGGPDGKGAALATLAAPRRDTVSSLLPSARHLPLPPRRASRLDEPPELPILA